MFSNAGIACLQGPHQLAQKSNRIGFPFKEDRLYGVPFRAFTSKTVAALPVRLARFGMPSVPGRPTGKREVTSLASDGGTNVNSESARGWSIARPVTRSSISICIGDAATGMLIFMDMVIRSVSPSSLSNHIFNAAPSKVTVCAFGWGIGSLSNRVSTIQDGRDLPSTSTVSSPTTFEAPAAAFWRSAMFGMFAAPNAVIGPSAAAVFVYCLETALYVQMLSPSDTMVAPVLSIRDLPGFKR